MKTKTFIIIILILFLNIFSVNAANYGGDLRIKVKLRPFNLNPIYTANDTEYMINKQIFDTLVAYNEQGEIISNLAKAWEINEDSTVFRFSLKEDVYFHPYKSDGQEISLNERNVNADDWKWSFEYLAAARNKSPYADLLDKVKGYDRYRRGESQEISGIQVSDQYSLEIELKQSYAPFIYNLAKSAAVVMPAEAVMNDSLNFATEPVGTGAFKFGNFSKDQVTLLKNNNYWKNNYQQEKLPYLNQIGINFAAENKLKEKLEQFDLYWLDLEDLSTYQQQKEEYSDYQIEKFVNNNLYFAAVNYNSDLYQSSNYNKLKENLKSIINGKDLIGTSNLDNLILPEASSGNQLLFHKISNKLQEGGNNRISGELQNLKLTTNNSKTGSKIAQFIKNELKAENIELEVQEYGWAEYLEILKNNSFDSQFFIMSAKYDNQFEFVNDIFYSTAEDNYFGYQNERLDNLIDYLKLVNNNQSRERAFEIITDILINDNPFLLLFQGADTYLVSDELKGQAELKNIFSKNKFEMLYFD